MTWELQSLFARYSRDINRFLRRRGHSAEIADDLTQETFVRVLASPPPDVDTDYNPRAYLYQVSRNLSINYLRRESLLQLVDLSGEEVHRIEDPTPSAETIVYSRQCLAQVERALSELPERTRKAFEMHRLGGKTITAVAQELKLSTGRTWQLIHEAYRHLLTRIDGC